MFVFANGDRHEGQYKRDRRHGALCSLRVCAPPRASCLTGLCVGARPSGFGMYVWAQSGFCFTGDWVDGLPFYGSKTNADYVYTGEWSSGTRHGLGRTEFANGASTVRQRSGWTPHHVSCCVAAAGDWYEGQFYGGSRHGTGTYHWSNGREYRGDWQFGVAHGLGTLRCATGGTYTGTFRNGQRHGLGVLCDAGVEPYVSRCQ